MKRMSVIGRVCEILEAVVDNRQLTTQQLVEKTGIERTQLYRYLDSLEASGFVERGPWKANPQRWSHRPRLKVIRGGGA